MVWHVHYTDSFKLYAACAFFRKIWKNVHTILEIFKFIERSNERKSVGPLCTETHLLDCYIVTLLHCYIELISYRFIYCIGLHGCILCLNHIQHKTWINSMENKRKIEIPLKMDINRWFFFFVHKICIYV